MEGEPQKITSPYEVPPAPGATVPLWDLPRGQGERGDEPPLTREQRLYRELKVRLIHHSKTGKKLHAYARRCMLVIVILGTANSVSIATDYFPTWVLAAASGIVAICGALMGTMKFEENSAWAYDYSRKLKSCLYDLTYRNHPTEQIADKMEEISEEMSKTKPGFGNRQ